MQEILDAIEGGASGEDIGALPIPESYRAAHVLRAEQTMWEGVESADKDPRKSLHVGDVPTPELAPDEVYLGVMASSINFNTVWTSIFEPLPTFGFLDRLGKESEWGKRHALDHHVVGSDASGVVLRVGSAVRNWKPGDRVTVHCNYLDDQDPSPHDDSMLAANQRIWGFESNFGGLADLAVVKANQLMPKPEHLTWEEAAVNGLCASTSYRMLVGRHAAQMKQGDSVFVWGATGGIGAYGIQLVLNGGGTPVGVVSSPERVKLLEAMGCENVIDRAAEGYQFWSDETHPGRGRVAPARQEGARPHRRGPADRVRAPRSLHVRRVGVHRRPRRHDRHLRRDVRLHARVRQPPPLDEAEADRVVALRELPGGVEHEPPHRPGPHPAGDVGELRPHRRRRGGARRPPQRGRGQARRALPGARRRASASRDPEKRERIGEDKITLFQRHARGEL